MKERGLSKDEAFMMDTAAAAEVMKEQKHRKDKHKAAFGGSGFRRTALSVFTRLGEMPRIRTASSFLLQVRSGGLRDTTV